MADTEDQVRTGRGRQVNREAEVYGQIRELIVHGRLAPGTRIIETEVAARLGVSRTPVRSALQRLQQEGYIIAAAEGRKARPVVAPLTREDALELFEIVGGIEGLASRRAAGLDPQEREELARALDDVNQRLHQATRSERPDRNLYFALDNEFHHTYVAAGAGPRLRALHEAIKPQAERYIHLYTSTLLDEMGTSVQEHASIIEAVAEGDEEGAQRAVQQNWRNAALRLSRIIDALGERGSW